MSGRIWIRVALLASALLTLLALAAVLEGFDAGLLQLAPALLLLAPLVVGRYVGEDTLAALGGRRARHAARPAQALVPATRSSARAIVRGGRLIACALAERGPPARSLASR